MTLNKTARLQDCKTARLQDIKTNRHSYIKTIENAKKSKHQSKSYQEAAIY
jgi:hypothetical protein